MGGEQPGDQAKIWGAMAPSGPSLESPPRRARAICRSEPSREKQSLRKIQAMHTGNHSTLFDK